MKKNISREMPSGSKLNEPIAASRVFDFTLQEDVNRELGIR